MRLTSRFDFDRDFPYDTHDLRLAPSCGQLVSLRVSHARRRRGLESGPGLRLRTLTRQCLASIRGRAAHEVLSFIRAPVALVLGYLRIRKQRTSTGHFAVSVPVLRHQLVRGSAFLDPA